MTKCWFIEAEFELYTPAGIVDCFPGDMIYADGKNIRVIPGSEVVRIFAKTVAAE